MVYLFKVYILVAAIVFSGSAALMLAMFGWQQAREYSRALHVFDRFATRNLREPIAISRNRSRFHEDESLRLT